MVSPHSGFLKESVELLRVESDCFTFYIQGRPYHPTVEALQLHRSAEGLEPTLLEVVPGSYPLKIISIEVFSPKQAQLVSLAETEPYPLFYETQSYQVVLQKRQGFTSKLEFYQENLALRQAVKPLGREQNILTGILNFQNEVGYTDLEVRVNGQTALQIRLEIFPAKMDYKKDYQAILRDVHEEVYNLVFDFLRKTYQLTGLHETQSPSLTEFLALLQRVFRQLLAGIERVTVAPHTKLSRMSRLLPAERVRRAGRENLTFLTKHPERLLRDELNGFIELPQGMYRAEKIIESKGHLDFDTPENRFLRWMLERIISKLREIRRRLKSYSRERDPLLEKRLENMENQVQRLLRLDFLSEVGPMQQMSVSLVLQMAPGYREVYRTYLILLKGLSLQGDLFKLSLKDLAQLYEYWCFLKLHALLKERYQLVRQNIIRLDQTGLFVTLDKSRKAKVTYRNPGNGEIFSLYYNTLPPESSAAPTLAQRPDNVLSLKKEDSNVVYHYIFDAKYRLNPALPVSTYAEKYQYPGPEEEDINTMHRYRDAIVYQERKNEDYERTVFGAYVLFPYADEGRFREHRFYQSIKKVNVGAFPFLPQATRLVAEFLDELIGDSPEKSYERATRPRGTESYFREKLRGKDVLIGALRDRKQLQDCLQGRFYHMPLTNIIREQGALTQIRKVGIYQSRHLFGEQAGIRWVGVVDKWEVMLRQDIKDRPARHGTENELYVRFAIREWTELKDPILPGGNSVYRALFTSEYILERAREIAELRLETEEQIKEWREKRRQGKVIVRLNHVDVDRATEVVEVGVAPD